MMRCATVLYMQTLHVVVSASFDRSTVDSASLRTAEVDCESSVNDTLRLRQAVGGPAVPPLELSTSGRNRVPIRPLKYQFSQQVMMGEKELDLFDRMLLKGSVYFEFGMGGSTLFAYEHPNLKHITAVDASPEWVEKVRSEAALAAGQKKAVASALFMSISALLVIFQCL